MRFEPILCLVGACSWHPSPAEQASDASATSATHAIDEATVKAISHALLDAYDRADEDRVAAALRSGFVLLDERRLEPRDSVLAKLHKRLARRAPPRART